MKIPNINYSPLAQAYQNKKAAVRASYIADKIGFEREGLKLEDKALDLKLKGIKLEDSRNRFETGIKIGQMLAGAASAASAAQSAAQAQQANAMMNTFSGQLKTTEAQLTANGELGIKTVTMEKPNGVTTTKPEPYGLDKLQSLQNKQIAQIQAQGWNKDIERKAIDSLKGIYENNQTNMYLGFYAQAKKDQDAWEQINRQNAIRQDSAEVGYTDYRSVDSFIESIRKNYSPKFISMLEDSMHKEVDINRAYGLVRQVTEKGGLSEGIDYANKLADENDFSYELRSDLIKQASSTSSQTKTIAQASGAKFMTDVIESGSADMGRAITTARAEAKEKVSFMSPEAGEAYMAGIDKVQLKYNTDTFLNMTKGDNPELMTTLQLEERIDQIDAVEAEFDGSSASRKVWENMRSIYSSELKAKREDETYLAIDAQLDDVSTKEDLEKISLDSIRNNKDLSKRDKRSLESKYKAISKTLDSATMAGNKQAQKDYIDMQNALIDSIPAQILNGDITVDEGKALIRKYMTNTRREKEAGNLNLMLDEAIKVNTTGLEVIGALEDKIKTKYKTQFDALRSTITTDMTNLYESKSISKEQMSSLLNDCIDWAVGDLMSVLCNCPNMSDADVQKEINRISNTYSAKKYEVLSKPVEVGMGDNQYETAMDVTAKYQDHPDIVSNNNDKKLVVNPLYKDEYEKAQKIQVEMLRNNYGIPVKNVYTIIKYKGNAIPEYVDSNGQRYVVMDNKVFKRFEETLSLEPIEPIKPFSEEGYAPIKGLDREHKGDANTGFRASSDRSNDYYKTFFR